MSTLAEVFVGVRPDMAKFGPELDSKLDGVDADPAGKRAGSGFAAGFGSSIAKIAGLATAAFAAIGVKDFLSSSIDQASTLSEAVNVTGLTFKDQAAGLDDFFSTSARSIGLSESAARQAASNIGGLLNNLGYTREASADTSKSILTLGADLGSAFNKDPALAVEAIGAALRGEAEPIRAFNVTLSDAALKAKALEMGLYSGKGALDANAKAQATLALITQQTADVQGDFANTADGLANKQRQAAAGTENLKAVIGAGLLPITTQLTALYADKLLPVLTQFATDKAPAVQAGFTRIITGAGGLYDLLVNGDYTGALQRAFGWDEDGTAVDRLLTIREAVVGLGDLLINGDYTGSLRRAFGWDEDSAVVDKILDIRDAIVGIDFTAIAAGIRTFFTTGDNSTLPATFSSISTSGQALMPVVREFIAQMPSFADVANAAAGGLAFLARHQDTLIAMMPLIVAAFVAWRVATAALILKQIAQLPLTAAQIASNFALGRGASALAAQLAILNGVENVSLLTRARALAVAVATQVQLYAWAAAVNVHAAATTAWAAVQSLSLGATLRSTAAMVASRVAMIAGTVATYAMAAASAVLSAVMSANPIGLVVAALVALVAGLVIAYRESETFRAIVDAAWAGIKAGVSATIDWLITAVPAAVQWVLNAFLTYTPLGIVISHWDQIRSAVGGVVDWLRAAPGQAFEMIKTAFLNYTPLGLVISHWDQIRAAVGRVVDWLRSAPGEAFQAIKSAFLNYTPLGLVISHWDQIRSAVSNAASGAKDRAIAAFTDLRSGVTGKVGEIVSTVQGLPGRISSAIGDLGSLLYGKGQAVVQGLIDGLRSRIAAIGSAANELTRAIASRLPGSPVKEGPLRVLNNGYAGGQIARMLADGITARGGLVQAALESSLVVPPVSAAVVSAAGTTRASVVTSSLAAATDGAGAGTGQVSDGGAAAGPYLPSSVILRIGDQEFVAFVEDVSTSKRRRDSKLYQGSRS